MAAKPDYQNQKPWWECGSALTILKDFVGWTCGWIPRDILRELPGLIGVFTILE
jgi:hypothetical protein